LLLVPDAAGWTLPCVASEERRAADTAPLQREAGRQLGIPVSILRCISDAPTVDGRPRQQVYELEIHSERASRDVALPAGGRGVGLGDIDGIASTHPELWASIDRWRADLRAGRPPADGRAWERRGWWERALDWVQGALERAGAGRITECEQLRLWEFSHVLRLVDSGGAVFYLKALPESGAKEPRLTGSLARSHPRCLPEVVAIEPA